MDSIAKKLQLLNCPANMYPRAYKHIASLELISLEELEQILRLLLTKKIIIPKNGEILVAPENFCVLANGFDVLKMRIEEIEKIGQLDAYREKLSRMNSKSGIDNLKQMINMGKPIKDGNKYSKVPFSLRRFNSINNKPKVETNTDEPQAINFEVQPEVSVIPSVFDTILEEPQEHALTDESFEEFERLMDSLQRIMFTVYGVSEVNDKITDNLIRLITSKKSVLEGQETKESLDSELLYTAITHGKNISEIEQQKIRNSIDDELNAAKEIDIELGRAA
ncbi:MAG: hypothetical protein IKR74_05335 [Bacilli bacterium]|nr:hypothetical protein [Bacilli bacterium]